MSFLIEIGLPRWIHDNVSTGRALLHPMVVVYAICSRCAEVHRADSECPGCARDALEAAPTDVSQDVMIALHEETLRRRARVAPEPEPESKPLDQLGRSRK